jgi:hypothetical protein
MPSSGMLRRVTVVRTGVSEELSAYTILVYLRTVCWLLVTANVVPSSQILVTLMMEALSSSETSVLTRAKRCNIPEDGILQQFCEPERTQTLVSNTTSSEQSD